MFVNETECFQHVERGWVYNAVIFDRMRRIVNQASEHALQVHEDLLVRATRPL